jgi:hypothetical protein
MVSAEGIGPLAAGNVPGPTPTVTDCAAFGPMPSWDV